MSSEMILKRSMIVSLSAAIFSGAGTAYGFDMCRNIFGKSNQSQSRDDYRCRNYGYGPAGYGYGYGGPQVRSFPYWSERPESAFEILDKRYAKGEIDKQEYEQKKATITSWR